MIELLLGWFDSLKTALLYIVIYLAVMFSFQLFRWRLYTRARRKGKTTDGYYIP